MYTLLCSYAAAFLGLALFSRGFLLTRREVTTLSGCRDLEGTHLSSPRTSSTPIHPHASLRGVPLPSTPNCSSLGCWLPPTYDRVVVLVIDAWRYDFAAPQGRCVGEHAAHCNRMPLLGALLKERPAHARLYRATVDAPTVTMQRVKALATGSLPTFIDVGASFTSGRVGEDNWMLQEALRVKACTTTTTAENEGAADPASASVGPGGSLLLGDDTWYSLFPEVWTPPSHPGDVFAAFDTRDLDSGDARVTKSLLSTLQSLKRGGQQQQHSSSSGGGSGSRSSNNTSHHLLPHQPWRILVAHSPGVDHVGHTHHAHHPQLTRKLGEMDALLGEVVAALEEVPGKSLLLALGDHGMTEDGNHGGSTGDESGAAFLAVSFGTPLTVPAEKLTSTSSRRGFEEEVEALPAAIDQIDLVPTLSLALGLPIPFGSLGRVLFDWEWGGPASHAKVNAMVAFGIARYLKAYASLSDDLAASTPMLLAQYEGLVREYKALQQQQQPVVEGVENTSTSTTNSYSQWAHLAGKFHAWSGEAAIVCRAKWAEFSLGFMVLGLVCLLLSVVLALVGGAAAASAVSPSAGGRRGGAGSLGRGPPLKEEEEEEPYLNHPYSRGEGVGRVGGAGALESEEGLGGGGGVRKRGKQPTTTTTTTTTPSQAPTPLPPSPPFMLSSYLPIFTTVVITARVWGLFTNSYITGEPALVRYLLTALALFLGACSWKEEEGGGKVVEGGEKGVTTTTTPTPSSRFNCFKGHAFTPLATIPPPLVFAVVLALCTLATEAPPRGWIHAGFLALNPTKPDGAEPGVGGGGGGAAGTFVLPPTLPRTLVGAGAVAPIVLPVEASEAWMGKYWGASLPVLLLLPLLPALLIPCWGARWRGWGGGGALTLFDVPTRAATTLLSTLASFVLWVHWKGGAGGGSLAWLSSLFLSPPLHFTTTTALPRAVIAITALGLFVHLVGCGGGGGKGRGRGKERGKREEVPPPSLLDGSLTNDGGFTHALSHSHGITSTLLPCAALFLGPWSPPILLLLFIQATCLVLLVATYGGKPSSPPEATPPPTPSPAITTLGSALAAPVKLLFYPSTSSSSYHHNPPLPLHTIAALVGLFSSHAWGATGHSAQFSALAYNAGFVGWGEFEVVRSGTMLAFNTFGISHCILVGPLLLLPLARVVLGGGVGGASRMKRGHPPSAFPGALALVHYVWAFYALAMLGIATLCTLERRHLMVWGVFAPKLVFDAVGIVVHGATLLVTLMHSI